MERIRLRRLRPGMWLIGFALICLVASARAAPEAVDVASQSVKQSISLDGRARVIVKLRTAEPVATTNGRINGDAEGQRRLDIATRQQRIRDQLRGTNHSVRREFRSLPYVVLEIDAAGLARLQKATGDVAQIVEDRVFEPSLADSVPQMEADLAHAQGYNGSGLVVAIIDSGVDNTHPFLAGKVVDEACFADRELPGDPGSCPNSSSEQVGTGAGAPCVFAQPSCQHGTHVAGIAAGSGDFPGVAPSANIFALQVFHRSVQCGATEQTPCARAFSSDITAALEYVYERRALREIASVNMSLGANLSFGPCDALEPAMAAVINNLKTARIATVVASGNSFSTTAISFPACITAAIAVGAVDDSDIVASFSNVSQDLDLFAPGVGIRSSIPGGGFASLSGTSMASPHVAGAWAVMRQANPLASVDDILTSFRNTGKSTLDWRSGSTITKPRIRLGAALGIQSPLPVLLSVSPASVRAWTPGATVSAVGSGFSRASVVHVNGAPRQTTYVSATQLTVAITNTDLRTQAPSLGISVVTPPPGGGTSATVPLFVTQPSLSVNTTTATAGGPVTVTLTNGSGVANDWIGLARVSDPNSTYLNWTYVGAGNSTFVWTINMPGNPGDYQFRLFSNGFTRTATSATVTVAAAPPPPPPNPPALAVNLTTASIGAPVTVTLTNGSGVASDWIALARTGDPNTTYLNWTYVGSGTTFVWTVNMPGNPGNYEFRLFGNGSFTRTATSPTIIVSTAPPPPTPNPPALAVNPATVSTGAPVTVTLTNGSGVASDWIALARVTDPNTTYLNWTYVGSGTTFVWTVNMPSNPADYEFRLFSNGGYTRIATSPTITVTTAPPLPATLAVNLTVASTGTPVTVTLANGSGVAGDWIGFARVGDPNTTYLNWISVGTNTTFMWTVNMPSNPGDYEFRLFSNGGYTRIATSPTVLVVP